MIVQRIDIYSSTEDVSYDQYLTALACLSASIEKNSELEVAFGVPIRLASLMSEVKDFVKGLAVELKEDALAIVKAFASKDVFTVLKAVGFNLKKLFTYLQKAMGLIKAGLITALERMEKEGWFEKLKQGTAKIDEVLAEFPILRKLVGPVIAGLLFFMWWNMSFTGDFQFDMDLSHIAVALAGNYSVEKLLATPNGIASLVFLGTGIVGLASFPWLVAQGKYANLLLALSYTGFKNIRDSKAAQHIKGLIKSKFNAEKLEESASTYYLVQAALLTSPRSVCHS